MPAPLKPAIFLDRDGTINIERGYIRSVEEFELVPNAARALGALAELGFELVVISNQSGVARGYLTVETLEAIHAHMTRLLAAAWVRLAGIYYCTHHPEDRCACRKPEPGLIEKAARDLGLDVARSYVIGDRWSDMRLAKNAGVRGGILISNPRYEKEAREHNALGEESVALTDILACAEWIGDQHG